MLCCAVPCCCAVASHNTQCHHITIILLTLIADALIKAQADVKAVTKAGKSAAYLAAEKGAAAVITALAAARAPLDTACPPDNATPMHAAAAGSYMGAVCALVEAGAKLDIKVCAGGHAGHACCTVDTSALAGVYVTAGDTWGVGGVRVQVGRILLPIPSHPPLLLHQPSPNQPGSSLGVRVGGRTWERGGTNGLCHAPHHAMVMDPRMGAHVCLAGWCWLHPSNACSRGWEIHCGSGAAGTRQLWLGDTGGV